MPYQANTNVHEVDGRIRTHDECIRKVEVAQQAKPQVIAPMQPDFHPAGKVKTPVLVCGFGGKRLLGESKDSSFGFEVGHQAPVISPEEAEADRGNPDSGNGLSVSGERITPEIRSRRLRQTNYGQDLGDIVHARTEKAVPQLTIILNASGIKFDLFCRTEDSVIAVRDHAFIDELTLGCTPPNGNGSRQDWSGYKAVHQRGISRVIRAKHAGGKLCVHLRVQVGAGNADQHSGTNQHPDWNPEPMNKEPQFVPAALAYANGVAHGYSMLPPGRWAHWTEALRVDGHLISTSAAIQVAAPIAANIRRT